MQGLKGYHAEGIQFGMTKYGSFFTIYGTDMGKINRFLPEGVKVAVKYDMEEFINHQKHASKFLQSLFNKIVQISHFLGTFQ